jgi:hypothetical protein
MIYWHRSFTRRKKKTKKLKKRKEDLRKHNSLLVITNTCKLGPN